MFKTKNHQNPDFMRKVFPLRNNSYNLRYNNEFLQPKVKTVSYGMETIRVRGPQLWQTLPSHIKSSTSLKDFKRKIRNWNPSNRYISKNFWGFVKNVIDEPLKVLPSFSVEECTVHFLKVFSSTSPNRQFPIPSWIPALQQTSIPFNLEPPSYDRITNVSRRMKASGSPCPLDQITIICFKRCPYLRSVITRPICFIWKSGNIPHKWKKACTILVHKKGDKDDPANFRPISH